MKECNRWNAKRSKVCTDGAEGVCERCWAALDAAPEMLEALKDLVLRVPQDGIAYLGNKASDRAVKKALAAIAKAESR